MEKIWLAVKLTSKEALAYSEFLKRVSFEDYRRNAISDDEGYLMQSAGVEIREALAKKGFEPR